FANINHRFSLALFKVQKQKTPIAANVRGFRFYILCKSETGGFCVIDSHGAMSLFGGLFR
ncbi:hypothetical protein ACQX5R_22515, partial [Salmonella enterica]|uniref:hypothetical protein n=1 Tax=Salmonella enterica TaxID=28901 RepID=UPI003D200184